jgi:hypothetical protein
MSTATIPISATKYLMTRTIRLGMSFTLPLAIGLQIVESVPQEAAEETPVDGLMAFWEDVVEEVPGDGGLGFWELVVGVLFPVLLVLPP